MFKKGQFFRRIYNGYISDLYLDSEISIKTTNIMRTYMSAAMVLAGMYPPKSYQKWSNLETVWQPIPIYNDSPDHGLLFNEREKCPSFDSFMHNVFPSLVEFNDKNITESLLSYLTEKSGQPITKTNLINLYDLFFCQMADGLQLPEWIKPYHINMMRSILNKDHLTHVFGNPRIQNILIGPLLKEIVLNMELRSKNYNHNMTKKMHLYSGHDVSLASVLGFLRNIQSMPGFGASLHFHVYRNETIGHTVKIFYHDQWDNNKGEEILIPFCSDPCKMQDFNKIVEDNFSTKWEEECHNGEIN